MTEISSVKIISFVQVSEGRSGNSWYSRSSDLIPVTLNHDKWGNATVHIGIYTVVAPHDTLNFNKQTLKASGLS